MPNVEGSGGGRAVATILDAMLDAGCVVASSTGPFNTLAAVFECRLALPPAVLD